MFNYTYITVKYIIACLKICKISYIAKTYNISIQKNIEYTLKNNNKIDIINFTECILSICLYYKFKIMFVFLYQNVRFISFIYIQGTKRARFVFNLFIFTHMPTTYYSGHFNIFRNLQKFLKVLVFIYIKCIRINVLWWYSFHESCTYIIDTFCKPLAPHIYICNIYYSYSQLCQRCDSVKAYFFLRLSQSSIVIRSQVQVGQVPVFMVLYPDRQVRKTRENRVCKFFYQTGIPYINLSVGPGCYVGGYSIITRLLIRHRVKFVASECCNE